MKGLKPTFISILAVGLLAGSAVGVAAQDEEATAEPSTPAIVSGNMVSWGDVVQEETETEVDGVRQRRGMVSEGARFEMDDPRLTGTVSYETNGDARAVGGEESFLVALAWHIENEDGSWSGSCPGLFVMDPASDPSMPDPDVFSCLYTGEGAYEGLSAFLVQKWPRELPYPIKGLIFEGDMPPTPEMSSAE